MIRFDLFRKLKKCSVAYLPIYLLTCFPTYLLSSSLFIVLNKDEEK